MATTKSKKEVPGVAAFTPLQQRWTDLWTTTLPKLASSRSTPQGSESWPVITDHSFARVILDNAVGIERPWSEMVDAPATINMTKPQLEACVALGDLIVCGKADIWELSERSLKLRGIVDSGDEHSDLHSKKRKRDIDEALHTPLRDALEDKTVDEPVIKKTRKQEAAEGWSAFSLIKTIVSNVNEESEVLPDIQYIITQSRKLTPFQKESLILLTQVPRGRYTTYQAISDAIFQSRSSESRDKSKASGHARAVGMAMRTNPFAPTVPCHRVLARDGRIGGFKGDWGKEGKFFHEKMRLLKEEGVRFDAKDKAIGRPFKDFV